jgi:hypothetical protein
MNWRLYSVVACFWTLALAAACSGDEEKAAPDENATDSGGEATSSGGSGGAPRGGTGGAAAGVAGSGGKSGSPSSAGGGNAGRGGSDATSNGGEGEPLGGGPPTGAAGETNQPGGPVSACGAGNYDAGEPGCMVCPALPTPNDARVIDCDDFVSAERDGDGNLILSFSALSTHELFGGEVDIEWAENGVPGAATVVWEYSPSSAHFVFHPPLEARYADEFTLGSWTFTDACGFSFTSTSLRVSWDGVESWQCDG